MRLLSDITHPSDICERIKMMTDDIYTALCKDDVDTLRELMRVGTNFYNIQLWEGTKIWPRITRRMTAVQLAVREGEYDLRRKYFSFNLCQYVKRSLTTIVTQEFLWVKTGDLATS